MSDQAPPTIVLKQALHFHIPTAYLLTESFPQNWQLYFECYEISYFLAIFLRAPPYLVPYFPTIPYFLVLFAMLYKILIFL